LGSGPISASRSNVGASSGESWQFAGALSTLSGIPTASTTVERLSAGFASIDRACAGSLGVARRLGGAAVQRHVTQLETDQPVVAVARELLELLELLHAAASIQASRRRRSVVAEHVESAILSYAQPNTDTCTSLSKISRSSIRGL